MRLWEQPAAGVRGPDRFAASHGRCILDQHLKWLMQLRQADRRVPLVVGGSVITLEDGEKMRQSGVAAVLTSSTGSNDLIECVRALSASRKRANPKAAQHSVP